MASLLLNNQHSFSQEELCIRVFQLAGKTDEDLGGGDFVNVAVSNPILILGFMEKLNINKVEILDINNADGALVYDQFWQNQ